MRRLFYLLPLLGMGLLAPRDAVANVSLKNGNFFIEYTDAVYSGGFEPKVERVYNSKTSYKGIFGWGWGSEYEVYLRISADGSVTAHEYGGGEDNRFVPQAFSKPELEAAVAALVQVARKTNAIKNDDETASYRKRLMTDSIFRADEWEQYRKLRMVATRDLPIGSILHSVQFGYQTILRIKDGYTRAYDNGRTETYDNEGRLVRIADKNKNYIRLFYDAEGKLESLVDNFNRKIRFAIDYRGRVESITIDDGRQALYRYDDQDNLVYNKDVDGNTYEYAYDEYRHNMTSISYVDGTTLKIAYYSKDLGESVRSITDRDGTVTDYNYKIDPKDPGHTIVTVVVSGADTKPISRSTYEYFFRKDAAGEEHTARMIADLDGDKTDTHYNLAGLPTSIKRGDEETRFAYDEKGHVTRKETPIDIIELKYDNVVDKVTWVKRTSKVAPKESNWSQFDYDRRGNLIFAKNSLKQTVKLNYDDVGRISELRDQHGRRIQFEYNRNSKPVVIRLIQPRGKRSQINVTYKANDEIDKVTSDAGRKTALAVTSAFQELEDIIRPAGVSLSF